MLIVKTMKTHYELQVNVKLNKDKKHFRYTSGPFFSEVIYRNGVKPNPQNLEST